jgi:hypothetical protein
VSDLFYYSKSKYAEVVVVASMEVSQEENIDKTKPYFMPCHQVAAQYCYKND